MTGAIFTLSMIDTWGDFFKSIETSKIKVLFNGNIKLCILAFCSIFYLWILPKSLLANCRCINWFFLECNYELHFSC